MDILQTSGARAPKEGLASLPQSTVSPAEIVQPYREVAKAVGFLGDRLQEAAIPYLQADGAASATRDADGKIQFDQRVGITPGDRAYNAAALQGALALGRSDVGKALAELRVQYDGDPAGYQKAAAAYAKSVGKEGHPLLRPYLRLDAENTASQHFESLTVDRKRMDLRRAHAALDARQSEIGDELSVIADAGQIDSDPWKRAFEEWKGIQDEKVANPQLVYTPEQRRLDDERMIRGLKAKSIVGTARRDYAEHGDLARAQKKAEDALTELGMPAEERLSYLGQVNRHLSSTAAVSAAEMEELRGSAALQVEALKNGGDPDSPEIRDTIARLKRAKGGTALALQLEKTQIVARYGPTVRSGSASEAAGALRDLRSRDSGVIDRIVGVESGGVARAKNPRSSATGAGQFIESTWLDMVARHRPELGAGKSREQILALRNNPQLSREMTRRYAEDNAERLRDADLPVTPGTVYLSHFAGSAGARAILQAPDSADAATVMAKAGRKTREAIIAANPFLERFSVADVKAWADRKMGGQGVTPAVAAAAKELRVVGLQRAKEIWAPMKEAIAAGQKPTEREWEDLATLVTEVHDPDLLAEVRKEVQKGEVRGSFEALPAGTRAKLLDADRDRVAGGFASPEEREAYMLRSETDERIAKSVKSDPYRAAEIFGFEGDAGRTVRAASALPDFRNPTQLGASFQARAVTSQYLEAREQVTPRSMIQASEVEAFESAMRSADAPAIFGFFSALTSVRPENVWATLSEKSVRETLMGLTRTTDPTRFNAAMSGLEKLARSDVQMFDATFGQAALEKVMNWQALQSYRTPEELVKDLTKPTVGPEAEQRKLVESEAKKKFRESTSFEDVQSRFGSSAAVPDDGRVQQSLMSEYEALFVNRYLVSRDEKTAQEQAWQLLDLRWGVSEAGGGVLMKYPPEKVPLPIHPTIDGSRDWMKEQIEGEIAKRFGRRVVTDPLDPQSAGGNYLGEPRWSYQLAPLPSAPADIAAFRAPRYAVAVKRAGQLHVIADESGRPLPFYFDPRDAQAKNRARLRREEDDLRSRQDIQRQALEALPTLDDLNAQRGE